MAPTVKDLHVLNSALCGFALLVTIFRLWIRYRQHKLWWDDFWVFLAGLFTIVLTVANFLHTANPDSFPQNTKIAIYYLAIQFYYAVSWTSRLSILFTVIRLSFGPMRRALSVAVSLFLLSWAVLFAQIWWVCEGEPSWKTTPVPQCVLGEDVAIAQAITVIVTDAILVVAPIKLVWNVRLSRPTKIRLIAIFASTLATTGVSLYYIYALLRIGGLTEEFAATIHDGVSLLVANFTVIFAYLLKSQSSSAAPESDNTQPLQFMKPKPPHPSTFRLQSVATSPTHIDVHIERSEDMQSEFIVKDNEAQWDGALSRDLPDLPDHADRKWDGVSAWTSHRH